MNSIFHKMMSSNNKSSDNNVQDKHSPPLDKRKLNLVLQELLGLTMSPNREGSSHESSTTHDSSSTSNKMPPMLEDTTTTSASNVEPSTFLNIHNCGISESECLIPSLKSSNNFTGEDHTLSLHESTLAESTFTDTKTPTFQCKSSDGNNISSLKCSTPCDYGECLPNYEEEDTPFDEPPSFYSSKESSMTSADVVGRYLATSPSSNGQHLKALSLSELHGSQDSPSFDFERHFDDLNYQESIKLDFDVEAFESHILAETSNMTFDLGDDSSYSSHSSLCSESTESSSCLRIKQLISSTSEKLDKKLDEILNFDSKKQHSTTPECKEPTFKSSTHAFMKPKFAEEKWKPRANHLPLKKRLIYRVESEEHINIQMNSGMTYGVTHQTSNAESLITPKKGFHATFITPSPTSTSNRDRKASSLNQDAHPPSHSSEPSFESNIESNEALPSALCKPSRSMKKNLVSSEIVIAEETTEPANISLDSSRLSFSKSKNSTVASALIASTLASNLHIHHFDLKEGLITHL